MECDVAIIGGGPAGSTAGALLKKYAPHLKVCILERERFPRDHVGESQLPAISSVLEEMGVWSKVEAANFPVKIGATYRWGRTPELWDFEFLPNGIFTPEQRPALYAGQRLRTAFQVDRAVYDKILLDHAASLGCVVKQEKSVTEVRKNGDLVTGLILNDESEVTARHYVDASGHSGIVRRAMGVAVEYPTALQNIAIWDYWQNADWEVEIGVGGTRVQVLSLPYGWIWFIPLGPNRTSIGLIVPASYYKEHGRRPEELYLEAIHSDPKVSALILNATREQKLSTTKDWSFVAERLTGENWYLAGESAGFADPILAAGMTLAHYGARDVAYMILAMERKDYEPDWLRDFYCSTHRSQIKQHIRFADFWYTHNGIFSDLKDHAQTIAAEAGLNMSSDDAWRWLGQGGFIERNSQTSIGAYGLLMAKELVGTFTGGQPYFEIEGKTHFVLNLEGAEKTWTADMEKGRITRHRMYKRNGKILPLVGVMAWVAQVLKYERSFPDLVAEAEKYRVEKQLGDPQLAGFWTDIIKCLEALIGDGWVIARVGEGSEPLPPPSTDFSAYLHAHER